MADLVAAVSRLRRFGQAMQPTIPHVEDALGPTRALLEAAGVDYKLIGGLAVIHHGYERLTVDIDVLVDVGAVDKLAPLLETHGFTRVRDDQLRHDLSGVKIDVLVEGVQMARPGAPLFPSPAKLRGSAADPRIVALAPLCELKLYARRLQDLADVAELLKPLDELAYTLVEAELPAALRPELYRLRLEALDELAMEQSR
jgi:hypothetical protein